MRLLIYIAVAYIIYTLVKKFFISTQGSARWGKGVSGSSSEDEGPVKAEETVLDPVCESYIPKNKAVKITHEGKAFYFCGVECRDKFTSEKKG